MRRTVFETFRSLLGRRHRRPETPMCDYLAAAAEQHPQGRARRIPPGAREQRFGVSSCKHHHRQFHEEGGVYHERRERLHVGEGGGKSLRESVQRLPRQYGKSGSNAQGARPRR